MVDRLSAGPVLEKMVEYEVRNMYLKSRMRLVYSKVIRVIGVVNRGEEVARKF